MRPELVEKIVGTTPCTPARKGREIHEFIVRNQPTRCLELGFAHGVATTWIAAALDELGEGTVVAVDNRSALDRNPSAQQLLASAGLEARARLHIEDHSYTWHLMRNLEAYTRDPFDFVFLDGAHTWDTDGFAFLLLDRMIAAGGWILFDDLGWRFDTSPSLKNTSLVGSMSAEMKSTPQVRLVWEKLVLPHPSFCEFREKDNWGWARKKDAQRATTWAKSTPSAAVAERVPVAANSVD